MASTSSLKALAYVLHILCTLLALVLIGFGAYILFTYDVNPGASAAAYAYIVIGVAAILIFLWGYLAAWREHVCCTVAFVSFLYLIIIAQVAVLYLIATNESSAASNLANTLEDTWEQELASPGAMSMYENWFQCCGRGSPQDYIVNERLPPESCFRNHNEGNANDLIHRGCRIEFVNYWANLLRIFNYLGWVLVAIELLLSFFSCGLCNSIRNDHRRSRY